MTNLVLNGLLLPLMVTYFLPLAIEKHGNSSTAVQGQLVFILAISSFVYIEEKGWFSLLIGAFNCILVFVAASAFIYFKKSKKKKSNNQSNG